MQRIKAFLRNYKISIPLGVLILLIGIGVYASSGKTIKRETVIVKRGTVLQEVNVTGRVKSAGEVNLSIQSGGKVTSIPVKVGQQVKSGQILLKVDSADLAIRLGRQRATLEKTKLALTKQEPGAGNAADDLKKAYEDGFNTIADTYLDLPTIMTDLDNILNNWHHSPYLETEQLRPLGTSMIDMKNDTVKLYSQTKINYDQVFAKYKNLNRNVSNAEIDAMLSDTYTVTKSVADTVKKTRNLIDTVENKTTDASRAPEINTDQTLLDTYTKDTNTDLTNLLSIKNTIKDSRDAITNKTSDTASSQIDIHQAELDIQDTLVQIAQRTITSPVNGVVTKVIPKVGETISPGTPVVSVISENRLEIEANLPEADVAKITVGQDANVTLDAYGSDVIFKAKVISLDPAETLIDGVPTYKTTFQFIDADDRIKSGMTANIIVSGEKKENVLSVPQRSVITKNGQKIVQTLQGEKVIEKPVTTGLRGSDGSVEIIEGLNEGDIVIVFTEK
jgi:multidrug efflux pump subunit AcrA (membrane-fusion protein)